MQNMELSELVAAAKRKSGRALEELYKKTNHIAYYTALSILKNDEDAKDAVQDSYINVFSSIAKIQENAFINYLKMAVANTCKNNLKRKKPILFTTDEEESNALDSMEEQSEDFLPASYIDQTAKREQIMSIINELSDVQRTAILLFYYDEMSISQIAEVMECSESTVQSRISYAKKHIKKEVEKMEQQGDKLYGKAFIPVSFLTKLFAEDSKNHVLPKSAAKAIFHNVITSSAVAGSTGLGGFAAGSLLAKVAGLTLGGKALMAGIGAVVVIGGTVAGVAASGHLNHNSIKAAAVAANSSQVEAASSQTASNIYENSSNSTVTSSNLVHSSAASSAVVSNVSSKAATQKSASSHPVQKAATTVSQPSRKSASSAKTTQQAVTPSGDVATNDSVANAKWIVSHLGFYQSPNPSGAYYNPDNNKMASANITVGHNNGTTFITFYVWGDNFNSVAKSLFRFYLPNNYSKLFNMIDSWNNGSDACVGKHYTIDGRNVVFYGHEDAGQIDVQISDK